MKCASLRLNIAEYIVKTIDHLNFDQQDALNFITQMKESALFSPIFTCKKSSFKKLQLKLFDKSLSLATEFDDAIIKMINKYCKFLNKKPGPI